MATVLTLNLDGSFQEVQPITVSSGITNAGSLVQLDSFGQLDPSVIPPIPISLINASGSPSSLTYLRGDGSWQTVSSGFTNPMLSLGDLLVGGISGLPQRLPIGTDRKSVV